VAASEPSVAERRQASRHSQGRAIKYRWILLEG
jgi:hypothetical protein